MKRYKAIVEFITDDNRKIPMEDDQFPSLESAQRFCNVYGYKLVSFAEAEQKGASQ